MNSILQQCPDCCTCYPPEIMAAISSKTLGICGLTGFAGHLSTPPKRYRRLTLSGTLGTTILFGGGVTSNVFSGGKVLTGDGCAVTDDCTTVGTATGCPGDTLLWTTFSPATFVPQSNEVIRVYGVPCGWSSVNLSLFWVTAASEDSKTWDFTRYYDGTASGNTGSFTATLSDEYLPADLKAAAIAALPAYGALSVLSPIASCTTATDGSSVSVEKSQYKPRFKIPKVGGGTCYKLKWVTRFTPADGGDPVDTEIPETWSGTIPGGYDAETPSTWPVGTLRELSVPDDDGETVIGYYTDPDDPDTFERDYVLAECDGCE